MHSKLDDAKQQLIAEAARLRRSRKGHGGLDADKTRHLLGLYYRHAAPEDLLDRSPVDVYGAAMSHYRLAAQRPQGTATVRVFTPRSTSNEWAAAGHSVVEIVTDDMPFLVDSVTMALTDARPRDPRRHPPAAARPPRRHRRSCSRSATPSRRRRRRARTLVRESWMHIEIDRETDHGELDEIEQAAARRPARRPRGRRGLGEDEHPGARRSSTSSARTPPPLLDRRGQRGAGAAAVAGRRPLHVPRLPRVPAAGGRRRGRAARRARHRPRHPALRPGHVRVVRQAAAGGRGQGAREAAADHHQGQLAVDRAPAGLPRLRRHQDVRRERRGRRRAPLPRPVQLGRLHREPDPHPGAAREGSPGAPGCRLLAA